MTAPNILIFASGTKTGGGSGMQVLAERAARSELFGRIVGIVSNHERGGVYDRARKLGLPFIHMPAPWTAERYLDIYRRHNAHYALLSGWLKMVYGLPEERTVNIHPGTLPLTAGLHGHLVHEKVIESFRRRECTHTHICMHFVPTGEACTYDSGRVFFRLHIKIHRDETPESLALKVNKLEHGWQWRITDLVLRQQIELLPQGTLRLPPNHHINIVA